MSPSVADGVDVYVALGSNLGDRKAHLDAACIALSELCSAVPELQQSSRIETEAVVPDERSDEQQPNYLNAVAKLVTSLSPLDLLDALQRIELTRGRQREGIPRWSARPLDLDLLLYGDQQIRTPRLTVPHPLMMQREFVLQPLAEITPTVEIPGTGLSAAQALAMLRADSSQPADDLKSVS